LLRTKKITVASMTVLGDLQHSFTVPLSEIAYDQFCEVTVVIQSPQLNGDKDVWSYIWVTLIILLERLISTLWEHKQCIQLLVGYGNHRVK
jgi:hypothetical protein